MENGQKMDWGVLVNRKSPTPYHQRVVEIIDLKSDSEYYQDLPAPLTGILSSVFRINESCTVLGIKQKVLQN